MGNVTITFQSNSGPSLAARESHNERTRNTLKHSNCSHKWWETLEGSIFGVKPTIRALRRPSGGLVVASAEKLSLTPWRSVWQQAVSWAVSPPLSCFPRLRWNSLAFWASVYLRLLLDLDTYGGVDPLSVFPLFLKKVADIIARKLSMIFRRLVRLPIVTAIPKGAISPHKENYRPISITTILSKVYDKLLSRKLSSFWEKCGFLPSARFAYIGKVWAALMNCLPYLITFRSP